MDNINEINNNILFDLPEEFTVDLINIVNRETIEYVELKLIDNRIDNLLFSHYGNNYPDNYGISQELMVLLILCFNDINDLFFFSGFNQSVKLPNIYQLLNNISDVALNNKVNGLYDDIDTGNNKSNNSNINNIDTSNSNLLNELKLKLSRVNYNTDTGIIKY